MELRSAHGFGGSYEAGQTLRAPQRVWRVESEPGEEVQVDFMQGPLAGAGAGTALRQKDLRRLLGGGAGAPGQKLQAFMNEHPVIRGLDHYGQLVCAHAGADAFSTPNESP